MTANAAQFVGSIPQFYHEGLGPCVFAGYAKDMARRVAVLNPGDVLELAAGTGIVTGANGRRWVRLRVGSPMSSC